MGTGQRRARTYVNHLLRRDTVEALTERLGPSRDGKAPRVPTGLHISADSLARRWDGLPDAERSREALADALTCRQMERYEGNIENFIGTLKVPVGLAGPLRVNGLFAQGDYHIPLATTEAALVASYSRGAQLISEVGGCSALLLDEGVGRAPGFAFHSLADAGLFAGWAASQMDHFRREVEGTTRHGRLQDMQIVIEGNHVYLYLDYRTGDAAGQNMVTIATEAIRCYIQDNSPVPPLYSFVEANLSGDKKASAQSFGTVRGKKVTAEVRIPAELVRRRLRTTPRCMTDYWQFSALGGVLSGTMGVQGHYANGLAALYLACGQDVACVAESAVGITRFEMDPRGDLYAAVTLPNLIVGTVGGGTCLPSQAACLRILGLAGPGHAQALAEVCAGVCLAGELSLAAAICSGDFAHAHQTLARGRRPAASHA